MVKCEILRSFLMSFSTHARRPSNFRSGDSQKPLSMCLVAISSTTLDVDSSFHSELGDFLKPSSLQTHPVSCWFSAFGYTTPFTIRSSLLHSNCKIAEPVFFRRLYLLQPSGSQSTYRPQTRRFRAASCGHRRL